MLRNNLLDIFHSLLFVTQNNKIINYKINISIKSYSRKTTNKKIEHKGQEKVHQENM